MEASTKPAVPSAVALRRLYRFMAPRRFVAGRAELIDSGFGPSRIDCWLRNGRLIKVVHGVYSYGRDVESRKAVWRAALIAAGAGTMLTGRSACEAWGMIRVGESVPLRVDVAARSGGTRVLRGLSPALRRTRISVIKRSYGPAEARHRDGIELASPIFALMDFSTEASKREVRFAFLEACRLGLFGRADVRRCYEEVGGRRGARKLKPLLALWVPELARIRSVLEGMILLALVESRLPMPKVNTTVCGYEVDFHWPEHGLILEADGESFHRDPPQLAIDAAKQRDLETQGLEVLRVTYKQFDHDPGTVLDSLATRFLVAESRFLGK